jgi:hypothetical protein
MNGAMVLMGGRIMRANTQLPQQRRHPPQSHLTHAERDNPNEVWREVETSSKSTARKTELLSGKGRGQEANAASRKATGIHNWADRAGQPEIPTLKGG